MNYLDFSGKNNPNAGKQHKNLNAKIWLIVKENGEENIIINIHKKEFLDECDKLEPFRMGTLQKYSKIGKFYKGYWCKEINDCIMLYNIENIFKSRYYKEVK